MSIVQKEYLTVTSEPVNWDTSKGDFPDPDDPFPPSTHPDHGPLIPGDPVEEQPILNSNAVVKAVLPMWFINAPPKYKKIIRVIGASVNQITTDDNFKMTLNEIPVSPGYRIFSNIVSNSKNVMISTRSPSHMGPYAGDLQTVVGKEGFVMMVNNYNSVKEFDVTMDNLREMTFFIRNRIGYTDQKFPSFIDFVCELELLLVDDN